MTPLRIAVLIAAAAMAGPQLAAQAPPESFAQIPVIPGSRHDAKGEALLPKGKETDTVHLYRIAASIEEVFKWYQSELSAESGEPLDSPMVAVQGITPVRFHVQFHRFTDECADSALGLTAAADSTGTCHKWRRGKDKRRALALSRLPYDPGLWIEDVKFTWFCRDPDGTLRRLRVEIHDIGLKPDWTYSTPLGEVRIESVVLGSS